MAFVKFTRSRSRIDTPKVSIWSRGQIGFNQGAIDEYKLSDYQYVVLYYDKDTNRVGLEFTNDGKAKGISKLAFRKNTGASFSAIPFLKSYKIDYNSSTRQFDLNYDEETKLYVIDLNNPKN